MQEKINRPHLGYIWLTVFGSSIIIALTLAAFTRLSGLPLWSQSISLLTATQDQFFSADCEAKISVVPDQAVINLGITVTDTDVQTAQNEANRIMNQLQTDLQALNIDKKNLKTSNYSLYPNYDWDSGNRRITGYTVDNNLRVTVTNFELINQVIDTATADGVNQISDIHFTLSDAQQEEVTKQARQQAIDQAKQNATELAALTGIRLGSIVNVYESTTRGNGDYSRYNLALASTEGAADYGTDIQAGETTFTYSVTLQYQTL